MGTIDDYRAELSDPDAETIGHVYEVALAEVPEAEQGLGYGMPALIYKGKPLLSIMRARRHFGIYPFSSRVVEAVDDLLRDIDHSKGTIRIPQGEPVPDQLIQEIVHLRRREVDG